jgi:NAD(P)H-hydrate epimerase
VIPIVTPAEMGAIDRAAPEPVDVLVERAGAALARSAVAMLGGGYGRRVVVVAGPGNNGADGRAAARRLRRRGARVVVVGPDEAAGRCWAGADLLVDAAFGTGFRGEYAAPRPGDVPVLACDIPSGVDGLTGVARGAVPAEATTTFAALKPGLVLADGATLAGRIEVVDIGLDCGAASAWLVERDDAAQLLPRRASGAHKWDRAVRVVAGSPGMTGAGHLVGAAANRAGAGMVVASAVGAPADAPVEAVVRELPRSGWAAEVLADLHRFDVLVMGPGVGRDDTTAAEVRELVARADVPVVLDADALVAVAGHPEVTGGRARPAVLTPHDGEYAALMGDRPGADRFDSVRAAARRYGCSVLLKGPTTIVAGPDGDAYATRSGDERLATAGTGDVLAGLVAALLDPDAPAVTAALAAFVHGAAARRGAPVGLVAGDLPPLVADELSELSLTDGTRRAR